MVSHRNIAKSWAEGKKSKGSRMFTDGKTIWSYGHHFPIAHKVGGNRVLFNTDKYSSSTSKHQRYVESECAGFEVFTCTTNEIQRAIDYPEEPILIEKYKPIDNFNNIMEALKTYCKSKGVKRFPMKQLTEQIQKMVMIARI